MAARTALFAAGNAVGVDVLVQVPDPKQASSANQNRRYFASTDHPVKRDSQGSRAPESPTAQRHVIESLELGRATELRQRFPQIDSTPWASPSLLHPGTGPAVFQLGARAAGPAIRARVGAASLPIRADARIGFLRRGLDCDFTTSRPLTRLS